MTLPARLRRRVGRHRYFCPVNKRDLSTISETRIALADGSARQRRTAAKIRLREIAAAIGVSPSTVSQWETGKREPGAEHALAYARNLPEQRAA